MDAEWTDQNLAEVVETIEEIRSAITCDNDIANLDSLHAASYSFIYRKLNRVWNMRHVDADDYEDASKFDSFPDDVL